MYFIVKFFLKLLISNCRVEYFNNNVKCRKIVLLRYRVQNKYIEFIQNILLLYYHR